MKTIVPLRGHLNAHRRHLEEAGICPFCEENHDHKPNCPGNHEKGMGLWQRGFFDGLLGRRTNKNPYYVLGYDVGVKILQSRKRLKSLTISTIENPTKRQPACWSRDITVPIGWYYALASKSTRITDHHNERYMWFETDEDVVAYPIRRRVFWSSKNRVIEIFIDYFLLCGHPFLAVYSDRAIENVELTPILSEQITHTTALS